MQLFGLIPVAVLALMILATLAARPGRPFAEAISLGAIRWGALAFASAEILGAFHALARPSVAAIWIAALAACLAFVVRRRDALADALAAFRPLGAWLVPIGALLALGLVQMALYPPNTVDALIYHLPRVEHWIANRSLSFYPTIIHRQLFSQPFAEIAILHIRMLSGGDRFVGMVQWLAYGGCIALAYGQAELLGCKGRGRIAAAIFAATIPMAVLQSSTAQNDLVVSFWAMSAAYWLTRSFGGINWANAALFGASAGLACLTKGTAYPIVLPMVAVFAFLALRCARACLLPAMVAGAIFLSLNAPHWIRCQQKYGDIFGGQAGMFRPPVAFSTLVDETWFHLEAELAPLPAKAERAEDAVSRRLLRVTHVDEHSPRHFFFGMSPIGAHRFAIHQDFCPNPLHAIILLIAFPVAVAAIRRRPGAYAWICLAGCVVFIFSISWQPWLTRLHLPLFCLGAAVFGCMAERTGARRAGRYSSNALCALLLALAFIPALFSHDRALVPARWVSTCNAYTSPREHRYFAGCRHLCLMYTARADEIAALRPKTLGFTGHDGECEYLLWMLLRNRMGRDMPKIAYAGDGFDSEPRPDAIISLTQGRTIHPRLMLPGDPSPTPQ